MGKFNGYLLVSDFDGTLIDHHEQKISRENIDAIHSFVEQGGRFCGATGRTELNVRPFIADLPLSTPWIFYNGAAIYDWKKNDFLYKTALNKSLTTPFVEKIIQRFPDLNIQIYPGGAYCVVNQTAVPDSTAITEVQDFAVKSMSEITQDWLKVLFCSDDAAVLQHIETILAADPLSAATHKMYSGARYFEITAPGVNKGSALQHLLTHLHPKPTCVIAIGDYRNDLEMLQFADISAAPESALPAVKEVADIITACHTKNAIADLLRRVEQEKM